MSSVRLKRPRNGAKAGDVVSVPFAVGKELVAKGEAEYPTPNPPTPAAQPSELAAARQRINDLVNENIGLRQRLDAAEREVAGLTEEKKNSKRQTPPPVTEADPSEPGGEGDGKTDDLDSLTVADLKGVAAAEGVALTSQRRADIITAIRTAREQSADVDTEPTE